MFWGRLCWFKTISQIHRSTLLPLQDTDPTPSFGGFGLTPISASLRILSSEKPHTPVKFDAQRDLVAQWPVDRVCFSCLNGLAWRLGRRYRAPHSLSVPDRGWPGRVGSTVTYTITGCLSSTCVTICTAAQTISQNVTIPELGRPPIATPAYDVAPLRQDLGGSPQVNLFPANPQEGTIRPSCM